MTRETAIAVAKEALDKAGIAVFGEPEMIEQYTEEETNRYLAKKLITGSGWLVVFPLKHPYGERRCGSVYVNDVTGKTYGAQEH